MYDYDLTIIGGGSAGLTAARLSAALGARVTIIEKAQLGGDCLQYGCVPSKALISMNKFLHSPFSQILGVEFKPYTIDFTKIAEDIKKTIEIVAVEDSEESLKKKNISTNFGFAKFIDKNTLSVGDRTLTSKLFLIATGSKPFIPPIDGLKDIDYLTNETIFSIKTLPKSLLVIGGGPIGCEMAQAFSLLGSKVSIVQRNERLLPNDDLIASDFILDKFQNDIDVYLKEEIVSVSKTGDIITAQFKSGKSVQCEKILIAIGRKPNTEGMNLESLGIKIGKSGILVNEYLQTDCNNIYAAGDVTGPYLFTHFAGYQASKAATNALLPWPLKSKFGFNTMSWVTFVSPEIAHAGQTESQLKESNIYYRKINFPYSKIDRAMTEKKEEGFIQIYVNKKNYILGATIIGERAGELIMEIVIAKDNGVKADKLINSIHPYPTYSTGIQSALFNDFLINSKLLKFVKHFI